MKKLIALFVLATMALVAVTSCNKEEKDTKSLPVVSLKSSTTTFENGAATVTLTLSAKATSVIIVNLGISLEVPEGYIPLAKDQLVFDESVSISAGQTSTDAVIRLKDGFDPGTDKYQAVITIAKADGANVSTKDNIVRLEANGFSYNENPDGPENPDNPENPDDPENPDNPDEPGDSDLYDRIAVNGTASGLLFTFDLFEAGSIGTDELEEAMIYVGSYPLQMAYFFNLMMGEEYFTPYDFMNDDEDYYADFEPMDLGTYDVLIVGLNEDGNLTGEYNISTITIDGHELALLEEAKARLAKQAAKLNSNRPICRNIVLRDGDEEEEDLPEAVIVGTVKKNTAWIAEYLGRYEDTGDNPDDPDDPGELDVELVLQENWSVSLDGEVYDYEGDLYIDVTINLPGIQYFWMEENTQDDLDYYYGGTVGGFILEYQESYQSYLTEGYKMSDLAWSLDDDYYYLDVYNPGMQTTVYIAEFDEDGYATGRYGKTVVTLPDYEEGDDSYMAPQPARRLRVRVRK